MKQVLIFFLFLIAYSRVSSDQCYIKYIYDSSGNRIKLGSIGEGEVAIDITALPAADYKFNIYDAKGKILYHTSIIKQ